MKRIIKRFRRSNKLAEGPKIILFEKGDLFGAIHKATIWLSRFKTGKIKCVLKDKYDFEFQKYKSIINFANNYEVFSQMCGASNSYNITVEMEFKDRKSNDLTLV